MDVKYITQAETPFFLDEEHFKSTNEKRDNILNVLVLRATPGPLRVFEFSDGKFR